MYGGEAHDNGRMRTDGNVRQRTGRSPIIRVRPQISHCGLRRSTPAERSEACPDRPGCILLIVQRYSDGAVR